MPAPTLLLHLNGHLSFSGDKTINEFKLILSAYYLSVRMVRVRCQIIEVQL